MAIQEQWLAHVSTLIYDPVHSNRSSTRSALSMLGFHNTEGVNTEEALKKVLDTGDLDLLIVDLSPDHQKICELISKLRKGELNCNPFAVVIATSWERSSDLVQQALDCGTDSLLFRPFSAGQLKEHLQQHIDLRKPFVVTSDYVGPDRRRKPRPDETAELIQVPNPLCAKAKHGNLSGPDPKHMADARQMIGHKRVESHARHIGVAASLIANHLAKPNGQFNVAVELRSIGLKAEDLLKSCGTRDEFTPIAALCNGLMQTLRQLRDALASGDPSDQANKPLALLTEFARAVPLALNPMQNEADIAREIAQTVERIQLRRAS
jgi:CheY-like chemotaxis protein